jgi:aspartyl aminopeptidase
MQTMADNNNQPQSSAEKLREKVSYTRKNAWEEFTNLTDQQTISDFADDYKIFLSNNKTERKCVATGKTILEEQGFTAIENAKVSKSPKSYKYYTTYQNKNLAALIAGKQPITQGINFVLSHVDAPRLDLKPQPLYEDDQFALLKTHYYGGIKKYQWTALPLAIYGIVLTQDGSEIEIELGDELEDPIFMISDLLPHLARKQQNKTLKEAIEGEALNVLVGTIPIEDKDIKERIKLSVLEYLYNAYRMTEEDFISAEIELVPAGKARDLGFDRSMIGAYAHDDRSCSWTALQALLTAEQPKKPAMLIWTDREEIGSDGMTGSQGAFLEIFISQVLEKMGIEPTQNTLQTIFNNSAAISADVDALFDPTYKSVFDPPNTGHMNHGVIVTKYTGHGGKYGSSEASAEFTARIRKVFNEANVPWQTGQLGKVDEGGGGTIAKYIANKGINIIDCGPGVLNMHAPWEIVSKIDIYSTYLAYKAFYEKMS